MTKLDCTVTTCIHNAEKCCCKSGILVEEHRRRTAVIPAAEALRRTGADFFKNLFKTPESKLEVECDVANCLYNDDHQCRAERITIAGTAPWLSVRRNVQALGRSRNREGTGCGES